MIPMTSRNLAKPQTVEADREDESDIGRRLRTIGARAISKKAETKKSLDSSPTVAALKSAPDSESSASEFIAYGGHVLKVEPLRAGWRVAIFPEGTHFALHQIPYTSDQTGRDKVIAEAKSIVDNVTAKDGLTESVAEPRESAAGQHVSLGEFLLQTWDVFLDHQRTVVRWGRNSIATLKRLYFSIDSR